MENADGAATLTDVAITGNEADDKGGGIYISKGTVNLIRGSVTGNKATNGTAIYFVQGQGFLTLTGNPTINGTVVGGANP